jgi:hypothetical protein
MHQHLIAAAHAATAAQAGGSDRNILAFGMAALVFACGIAFSRKNKPSTGK